MKIEYKIIYTRVKDEGPPVRTQPYEVAFRADEISLPALRQIALEIYNSNGMTLHGIFQREVSEWGPLPDATQEDPRIVLR